MSQHPIGYKILHLERIDSTNNYAANLFKEKQINHGTVIMADIQTNGRGQRGNAWQSDPFSNLTASILLEPLNISFENQTKINHIVSLSIKTFLDKYLTNVNMKWPNDILIENKKIAGVLIENIWSGTQLKGCIIGIGLNVNQKTFNEGQLSTSLYAETNTFFNLQETLLSYCNTLQEIYNKYLNKSINESLADYNQLLWLKGKESSFKVGKNIIEGIIVGSTIKGELMLQQADGKIRLYENGAISFCERGG